MSYSLSCHCGAVALEAEGEPPAKAMSCNCSMCRRRGYLLHFVPAGDVTLTTPRHALADYRFNKGKIAHLFCTTCGCAPFGEGEGPGGEKMVALNLRCAEGIDLDALELEKVDGASF